MLQPRKASQAQFHQNEMYWLNHLSKAAPLTKKNALLLIFVCLLFLEKKATQAWNQYPGEKKYGNKTELHVMSMQ